MDTTDLLRLIERCVVGPVHTRRHVEGAMEAVNSIVEYLLANPIFLIPLLAMAAMILYALLKKLLKMAAIVVIAGVLYLALMEYFGGGL